MIIRVFLGVLALGVFLSANGDTSNKLVIDSDKFESNDKEGILIFTKNVKMTRMQDKLNANKVTVYLNTPKDGERREAQKYVAVGNVTFEVVSNDKHYEGKGDQVTYKPIEMEYEIQGNGYLKDITTNRTLVGESIYINQESGDALVLGSEDKPVRFIFDLEDNSNNENN